MRFYFDLAFRARIAALVHLFRGHKLHWRDNFYPWSGCYGDIWCEGCPDANHKDLCIWIRYRPVLHRIAQAVCGYLGHSGWEQTRIIIDFDAEGNEIVEDKPGSFYCTRCMKDHQSKIRLASYR